MTININLKELWNEQSTVIPDQKEILEKADNFRKKNLRKLVLTNILLLLTSAFIGFIWYYYQPEMITTKLGIVIVILAMIIFLCCYNLMIPELKKSDYSLSSSEYLKKLLGLKEKQKFLQTTMLNIYFIMLSAGIALYMYEYASRMKMLWTIFTYGLTFLWIAINWFYFRPKSIKKQDKAINELIDKFGNLSNQLYKEDQ
ncbi:MAG TPA: hypothetical protein PKA90_02755 [Ignavibacteria bacterium]|nr:hypothetical protein [Ignavibacteria bacterium]HMR39328.1 hypothetical protein [Ignavibacteria bacterium]